MENDGRVRAFSSPELLLPLPASSTEGPEDYSLEGDCIFFLLALADQDS